MESRYKSNIKGIITELEKLPMDFAKTFCIRILTNTLLIWKHVHTTPKYKSTLI